jgi:hypothetical protein
MVRLDAETAPLLNSVSADGPHEVKLIINLDNPVILDWTVVKLGATYTIQGYWSVLFLPEINNKTIIPNLKTDTLIVPNIEGGDNAVLLSPQFSFKETAYVDNTMFIHYSYIIPLDEEEEPLYIYVGESVTRPLYWNRTVFEAEIETPTALRSIIGTSKYNIKMSSGIFMFAFGGQTEEWVQGSGKLSAIKNFVTTIYFRKVTPVNITGTLTVNGKPIEKSHITNIEAFSTPQIGTFCETTGIIHSNVITSTDCICQVITSTTLNRKIVGIIVSRNKFASHGDALVKVGAGPFAVGDLLVPDVNGTARVATQNERLQLAADAIPKVKIKSLETGINDMVACFIS